MRKFRLEEKCFVTNSLCLLILRCLIMRWHHVEAVRLRSAQSTKWFIAQMLTHVHWVVHTLRPGTRGMQTNEDFVTTSHLGNLHHDDAGLLRDVRMSTTVRRAVRRDAAPGLSTTALLYTPSLPTTTSTNKQMLQMMQVNQLQSIIMPCQSGADAHAPIQVCWSTYRSS